MNRNLVFSKLCLSIALLAFAGCSDDEVSWPEVDGAAPKMELKTDHIRTDKGYTINVKGELADADGIMILPYFRPMECVFQARKSRQCEPDSSLG